MITVDYKSDGITHNVEMKGHACYSDKGDDIVCAAVSGILYALLGWLENNPEDVNAIDMDIKSGNAYIFCSGGEKTSAAFQMAIIGWEQIANEYPDHVVINQS